MQIIDLFSGIGGFSLAGRWMGWQTVQFCEIDAFCQRVLAHHFPGVPIHGNIRTMTAETVIKNGLYDKNKTTLLTGGFPCQPFSLAGSRKGNTDDRHLWPEMFRTIRFLHPDWVVAENVFGITNWDGGLVFEQVHTDLEKEGYTIFSFVLPACAVDAPHRRDRVWFVAHTAGNGREGGCESTWRTFGESTARWLQQFEGESAPITHSISSRHGGGTETSRDTVTGQNRDVVQDGRWNRDTIWGETERRSTSTANTTEQGLERGEERGEHKEHKGSKRLSEGTVTANTTSKRQPPLPAGATEFRLPTGQGLYGRGGDGDGQGWSNFPTQPPLCSRDDGLSTRLDGIAFSRWRNESIKAYGNAIVPEVVYRVYRVIDILSNIKK